MLVDLAIVAHGLAYQRAAVLSAATFARYAGLGGEHAVWLPADEIEDPEASADAGRFGVQLRRLRANAPRPGIPKPTAALKCGAWVEIVDGLRADAVLLADADTACLRALPVATLDLATHLAAGGVAAARDRKDATPRGPTDRWARPKHREGPAAAYVNSGVILAGPASLPLLRRCLALTEDPALHDGPFADQRALNHALAEAPEALRVLPWSWNAIRWRGGWPARVVHYAGGAGGLEGARRERRHHARCARLLA